VSQSIIIILPEVDYNTLGDTIAIIEYYRLGGQASSSVAEGKVPRTATRLNHWMAIERR